MTSPLTVNGDRMLARLDELAAISSGGPGVTRLAYSAEDVEARNLVAGWMEQAGLAVEVDAAANLIGRTPAAASGRPALLVGSHLDTVVEGGPLDGAYGVVAGVEVADGLRGCSPVPSLAVAAFANEEGVLAPPGRCGSLAIAGAAPPPTQVTDRSGRTLGSLMAAAGGRPEAIDRAAWPASSLSAYLELHIEQGPILDGAKTEVGVVDVITGRVVADVVISGTSNHAGTTPMVNRRDALAVGAEVVVAIRRLALGGRVRVATAGSIEVTPNVRNVIPGRVEIGVDLRDPDDARLALAVEALTEELSELAATTRTEITVTCGPTVATSTMAASLMAEIEGAARRLGLSSVRLPSGAGHDAQSLALRCPAAMIFVPSIEGISHAPGERSADRALVDGADVLLNTAMRLTSPELVTEGASP